MRSAMHQKVARPARMRPPANPASTVMHHPHRRHCLALMGSLMTWAAPLPLRAADSLRSQPLQEELAALEARSGGRLGVAVLDTASGASAGHRADTRFGLCSTFKLLLAAATIERIEAGAWPAQRRIAYTAADLVVHSPVLRERLAEGGLTALQMAQATQETSDNAAANLLMRELFGGPAGLTAWLRRQGDTLTRMDRWEPEMNIVVAGEERDTSTPAAIAATSARLLTGPVLSPAGREQLAGWMVATRTGARRLRAGLPAGWKAGDKTGTAMHPQMPDRYNDVAIVWPGAQRAPWLLAAYFESRHRDSGRMRPEDEAVLADVGRLVGRWQPAA